MAQVIPSITSLPHDSSAAPAAEDIQDRRPERCVDYLSHEWREEDVWASWRNMTRHKHEIANGVRLENASWRTWQKQRNKLKTISPETLNWLKDSDVTWLYGPLHTAAVEPVRPLRVAATEERLGIDRPTGAGKLPSPGMSPATAAATGIPKKPILKHRTLSEMLAIHTPSSPILEAQGDDSDSMDEDGLERPSLLQTKSDTNIVRSRGGVARKRSPPRGPISSGKQTPGTHGTSTPPDNQPSAASTKRHISFNTFVEQCVAVDDPSEIAPIEESDDDMLEMRPSSSSSSRSSRPSLSRHSSSTSEHLTIAMIAPTMLKTPAGAAAKNAPQMVYAPPPEYLSPPSSGRQGFDFPSPVVEGRRWQEDSDMYGSVGVDYFGGPDLGGGERVQQQVQQTGSSPRSPASSGYARAAPTVGQPPAQAKWRQSSASNTPGSVDSSSPSSSSSSQSLNQQVITSPTQTKGILKVRPPSSGSPDEPSSPPSTYFNYNPSAATGIGGMRGAQYMDGPGPSGSPVTSPGQGQYPIVEERGRSRVHARDRGSSAYDRSASRNTNSTSASSSTSPGTSRSPVGQSRRQNAQASASAPQASIQQQYAAYASPSPPIEKAQQPWEPSTPDHEMKEFADDKSETPTPHSSPQISFRPLRDASAAVPRSTSPSSLPHVSTRPNSETLPKPDAAKTVSPPASSPPLPGTASPGNPASVQTSAAGSVKPTTAHVSTNAEPTLAQRSQQDAPSSTREGQTSPLTAHKSLAGQRRSSGSSSGGGSSGSGGSSSFGSAGQALANATASGEMSRVASDSATPATSRSDNVAGPYGGGGPAGEDEDGSTIMGRAANIANTAKDLLGALWYGANEGQQGQTRAHKRGTSLG